MMLINSAIELVFPTQLRCIVCDSEILPNQEGLCAECSFIKNNGKTCARCGTPIETATEFCLNCTPHCQDFDRAYCSLILEERIRAVLHGFKYGGNRWVSSFLVGYLIETFKNSGEKIDYVFASPSTTKKKRSRGYNQSEVLAQEFCLLTGLPLISDVLIKEYDTKEQARLNREQRLVNLLGTMRVLPSPVSLKGKNLLLIDDVLTTGATMSACARALKSEKPSRIVALTVATPAIFKTI